MSLPSSRVLLVGSQADFCILVVGSTVLLWYSRLMVMTAAIIRPM